MPDDNQTVTEPRSAVEAASDPSHGGSVAQRTIKAGVERLKGLAEEGRTLVDDMMEHVLSMAGSAQGMPQKDDGNPGPDVSTNNMHRAIAEIETAFGVLGKLIASAKAAHG